jgi:hypothetical protein
MEYGRDRPKERKLIKKISRKRMRSEWTTGDLEQWLTVKIKPVNKITVHHVSLCALSNLFAPAVKLGDSFSICKYGFRGAPVNKATST